MPKQPIKHYYTDNDCGGVVEGRENTLEFFPGDVTCPDCISMMFDNGVLS